MKLRKARPARSCAVPPLAQVTLSEQAANKILDLITARRWKPGERLPSEAELCDAFAVSRSTVREALKSLVFAGYVRVKSGDGSYVADHPPTIFNRPRKAGVSLQRDLAYVIETRFTLEIRIAELFAERATDEDLLRIEELVNKMQLCLDNGGEGFLETDVEFHLAIAAGAKNPFLEEFMQVLREPVIHLMYALKSSGLSRAQAEHVAILQALKARDPKAAHDAMHQHLQTYWRRAVVHFGPNGTGVPKSEAAAG